MSFICCSRRSIPSSSFAEMDTTACFVFFLNMSSVTTGSRSALFKITMARLSCRSSRISLSFSSNGTEESTTYRIKSASFAYSMAFFTPIFSTTSSVLRIPAVSIMRREMPCSTMLSSRISLVVPAISVTMALSSPTNIFKREDFPALGFPRITVLIPSFISFPSRTVCRSCCSLSLRSSTSFPNVSPYPSILMCSGSSRADSI